jgi:transposase
MEKIDRWLQAKEQDPQVLPKSPLGKAIGYARGQWQALQRYLDDGDLEIDNNAMENRQRGIAVGRGNWLFAGSDEGGRRAALIYGLIESCKLHKIDPFLYLRDVLERIATHPIKDILELSPARWKLRPRPQPDPPLDSS